MYLDPNIGHYKAANIVSTTFSNADVTTFFVSSRSGPVVQRSVCEQIPVLRGVVEWRGVPKRAAIAMRHNFVRRVFAGRVANHAVRIRLTGTEEQLEDGQERLRNKSGAMPGMSLSSTCNNAWNIQGL